jgi:hypothetical protein
MVSRPFRPHRVCQFLHPGHRPAASALGSVLPARWAGHSRHVLSEGECLRTGACLSLRSLDRSTHRPHRREAPSADGGGERVVRLEALTKRSR